MFNKFADFAANLSLDNLQNEEAQSKSIQDSINDLFHTTSTSKAEPPVPASGLVEKGQPPADVQALLAAIAEKDQQIEDLRLWQVKEETRKEAAESRKLKEAESQLDTLSASHDELARKLREEVDKFTQSSTRDAQMIERLQEENQQLLKRVQEIKAESQREDDTNCPTNPPSDNLRDVGDLQSKVAFLQTQLEKSEGNLRQRNADVDVFKSKTEVLEAELTRKDGESATRVVEIRDKLRICEDQLASAEERYAAMSGNLEQLTSEKEALQRALDRTEQSSTGKATQLDEEVAALRSRLEESGHKLLAAENRYSQIVAERQLDMRTSGELQERADKAREQQQSAESALEEQKAKMQTLTEKFKDVMRRYADLKAKASALEESDGRAGTLDKQLKEKQAEIMSLQLKLESFQSNASETRGMNADLSEKLGDSQREIFRLKTSIEELQHTVENTNRDLARSEERVAALGKEKRQLQEEVQHLQEERAEMESSASDKLQQQESSFETAMQQQESSYEAAIAAMQTELQSSQTERDNLQSQLKSLDENNANFVEYKNRAQLAIKKANATAASLTDENERLQAEAIELQASLGELQELVEERASEAVAAKDDYNSSRLIVSDREAEIAALSQEKDSLQTLLEKITEEVQSLRADRDEAVAAAAALTQRGSRDGDSMSPAVVVCEVDATRMGEAELTTPRSEATPPREVETDAKQPKSHAKKQSYELAQGEGDADPDWVEIDHGVADQLVLVNELSSRLEDARRQNLQKAVELREIQDRYSSQEEEKRKLNMRIEELMAFLERTKRLHEGPDSAVNMEYLKNCIYRFMATTEISEKLRLFPVISTILKLTSDEQATIEGALRASEAEEILGVSVSSLGAFFGVG